MLTFAQLGQLSLQMQMLYVKGMNAGTKPDELIDLPDNDLSFSVSENLGIPTMEICTKIFLDLKKYTVRQSTYHMYVRCMKNYILPFFGDVQLNKINGKFVQEFVNAMLHQGINPKTIKYCVARLKSVLLYAEADSISFSIK